MYLRRPYHCNSVIYIHNNCSGNSPLSLIYWKFFTTFRLTFIECEVCIVTRIPQLSLQVFHLTSAIKEQTWTYMLWWETVTPRFFLSASFTLFRGLIEGEFSMYVNHTGRWLSKRRILACSCMYYTNGVSGDIKSQYPFQRTGVWFILEGDDTAWLHVHGNSISVYPLRRQIRWVMKF